MPSSKSLTINKCYVVAKGRIPGIYFDWENTKKQIDGFSGAIYKSFTDKKEADKYYNDNYVVPEKPPSPVFPIFEPPPIPEISLAENQAKALLRFKQGRNVFITGPGGSGKSFLIDSMIKYAKSQQKNVNVCALTGCAALILNCGAKTVHSWGGIGLAKEANSIIATNIDLNSRKKRNW